ncbi:hypothetical protein Tco_0712981 [Tanacetum coccineum]
MASMNTRLNIKKLDGNIVQKHGGSKQVGFKQLSPGVETRVHGVHDEKRVWFEVKLQGAQGDREAEVFQVSNDDTAVAQRRLEDKQPEDKTNTDCLVNEQEKEYQTGWKIKTGNVLDSCNQRSTQQCMKSVVAKHLGVAGIHQQNGLVDETNVTLFAKARLKDDMDARSDIYVLSNGCRKCSDEHRLAITRIIHQAENLATRIHNEKLVQALLKGHSTLSLEDSLSVDCDVEKNDMMDRVRVDDTGCVGSLKANLLHIKALSTTEAGYMTFTEAWKKEIWLKGLLT